MNLWDKFLYKAGWPFARLFVVGKEMEDAFSVAKKLNEQNLTPIINFLGEEVKDRKQVDANVRIYTDIIREIHRRRLRARTSVKPSQLGLKINAKFYWFKLHWVARDAFIFKVPLEIDMETEDTVDEIITNTIALVRHYPGLNVCQAAAMNFKSSFSHLYNLTAAGVKIRLCKGAYPSKYGQKEVSQRFFDAASYLLRHKANPDFATHDLRLLDRIFHLRNEYPAVCGFQFLLGLYELLGLDEKIGENENKAIYVPFGPNWLPYGKRRKEYLVKKIPLIAKNIIRHPRLIAFLIKRIMFGKN